jgi:AcrR family transcriptional regulator|tara:strand:- start:205 stop:372 length:168 start_codon:yes stop_codon:yes gene_type:complete
MTTKHRFISVAKRQFTENGFDRTSIASIADELGLTKQALLHHFGPKKNLYGEVLL